MGGNDLGRNDLGPERLRAELVWGRIDLIPTEVSAIVKCRNGNNDDGNSRNKKKLRSEIQIKTFESAGFSMSRSAEGKHTYF